MIVFLGFIFGAIVGFLGIVIADVMLNTEHVEDRAEIARDLLRLEGIIKQSRADLKAKFKCPKCKTDVFDL